MAVTRAQLQLRAKTTNDADIQLLDDALEEATARVNDYIVASKKFVADIPTTMYDRAIISCALALFWQDKSPNGIVNQQYDIGDGGIPSAPIRISQDPMRGARAALAQKIPDGTFFA
jgi:hypothetical protein